MLEQILGRELIPVLASRSPKAPTTRPITSTPTLSPAPSPGALERKRLLLLTDVPGVLGKDKEGLIKELRIDDIFAA